MNRIAAQQAAVRGATWSPAGVPVTGEPTTATTGAPAADGFELVNAAPAAFQTTSCTASDGHIAGVDRVTLRTEAQKRHPKTVLAQMNVKPGLPDENVRTMLGMIDDAKAQGAEIIAFPELCVGGYLLGDEFHKDHFCEHLMRYNDLVREASQGITVIWGNVYMDTEARRARRGIGGFHADGFGKQPRYNAVYVAHDGKWAERDGDNGLLPEGVMPKTLLPNYRIFDDKRYFTSTLDVALDHQVPLKDLVRPFKVPHEGGTFTFGVQVCEDLWCKNYREAGGPINTAQMLIDAGAEAVYNLSASPWGPGKADARDRQVSYLAERAEKRGRSFAPFYYVNCVGAQNNGKNIVTFDGCSSVYNARGELTQVFEARNGEGALAVDPESDALLTRPEPDLIAAKYDAAVLTWQHLKDAGGARQHKRVTIGVSGGIDSALSLAMLVDAVGAENIEAVNMPTRYNSEETKGAAERLCQRFGVPMQTIPIEPVMEQYCLTVLGKSYDEAQPDHPSLYWENLQATLRGWVLANKARERDALMVQNTNKAERMVGYGTLYGDLIGAACPIGDMTKEEVYAAAHYVNRRYGTDMIPEALLPDALFRFGDDKIVPSAELAEAQKDPIKPGYHDRMIEHIHGYDRRGKEFFLQEYLQGTLHKTLGISVELMARYGIDNPKTFVDDLNWLLDRSYGARFKGVQLPPSGLMSKSAMGYDERQSILPNWEQHGRGDRLVPLKSEELAERVLKLERYGDLGSPEVLGEGKFLRLERLPGGWERVVRTNCKEAVALVAINDEGKVAITREPRPPIGAHVVGVPAGLVGDHDSKETVLAAAQKELIEEIGYKAGKIEVVRRVLPSAGMTNEAVTVVLATDLTRVGDGGGVGNEDITHDWVPGDQLEAYFDAREAAGDQVSMHAMGAAWLALKQGLRRA